MDFEFEELEARVRRFFDRQVSNEAIGREYELRDKAGWSLARERSTAFSEGVASDRFAHYFYRLFDLRWLYYSKRVLKRPVRRVMRHLLGPNLAIVSCRQQARTGFRHVFVTRHVGDGNAISLKSREWNYYCPLYVYVEAEEDQRRLPGTDKEGRRPNLSPDFIEAVVDKLVLDFTPDGKENLENTFGPEDVFHYMYAVFHSPTYRERYAEFLKIDFPRLPLTSDLGLFRALAEKGEELVALHLMESPALDHTITKFPITGSNEVEKVRYVEETSEGGLAPGRVYVNKTQYFQGVEREVWEFHIGGYQVLHKWLKDRKGRTLSYDDVTHYGKIVVALKETIRLMGEIDEVIPSWPIE